MPYLYPPRKEHERNVLELQEGSSPTFFHSSQSSPAGAKAALQSCGNSPLGNFSNKVGQVTIPGMLWEEECSPLLPSGWEAELTALPAWSFPGALQRQASRSWLPAPVKRHFQLCSLPLSHQAYQDPVGDPEPLEQSQDSSLQDNACPPNQPKPCSLLPVPQVALLASPWNPAV